MKRYDRLIFVSTSDTCRGPMAATILKSKFLLEELVVDSRGLIVLFPEPVNQKAEEILQMRGLTMQNHASARLEESDIGDRTVVLTMELTQKLKILEEYDHYENVYTLAEFIGYQGDITSPYGGTMETYEECCQKLDDFITRLVVVLNEEELLC
ncbi:MAG: phosphotyrosine protein phosphatase [Lachnospiraceae bacterium]|nr:phosphotyrosine protein phosphatase [Robinsoniella sp.]MDY3765606.1 phosphotyrosine protein phosphatase [Lachnospiraceae bacterium]